MSKKFFAVWLAGLVLLTLALFAPTIHSPFVLDDVAKIQDNPDLRIPHPPLSIFLEPYRATDTHFRNDPSRPVAYFFYWLAWQTGQGETWPFHILNMVFHIGSALFVGLLFLSLTRHPIGAVIASLLFLTLPLNAGTVAYAYGLSDILGAFFSLACLYVITRFEPNTLTLSTAMLLLIGALGSKQSAIVVPVLALMIAGRKRPFLIALWFLAACYLAIRSFIFGGLGDLEAEGPVYPALQYLQAQGVVIWRYMLFVFWPDSFSIDHALHPKDLRPWLGWLGWALLLVLAVQSARYLKNKSITAFGFLFFILSLLPVSSVLPTTDLMVERRAYFAVAGLLFILTRLLILAAQRVNSKAVFSLVGVLIGAQSWLTYGRAQVYSSEEKIWLESLNLYPASQRAAVNLSTVYLKNGEVAAARPLLESLVARAPLDVDAWANLGTVFFYPGGPFPDLKRAEECFLKALEIDPRHVKTISNLGFLKMAQQNFVQAAAIFRSALELSPRTPLYLYGAGLAAKFLKKRSEAESFFREALKWDPSYQPAQAELSQFDGP